MNSLVAISLGSNINPEINIKHAVVALREQYGDLMLSPVYQTASVGFDGEDFLNLVVSFTTEDDVHTVALTLKSIEDDLGRDRSQPKFSARSIDLDLLTYDDLIVDESGVQIPRHEILQNAFVLKPLSDIHGEKIHPEQGKSYFQLWQEMRQHADRINLFELELDKISSK